MSLSEKKKIETKNKIFEVAGSDLVFESVGVEFYEGYCNGTAGHCENA